jgi:hypothetical protein
MGWPLNCRNTVLSNGNCSGNLQFPDGDVMVSSTQAGGNNELRNFTYFGQLWRSILLTAASPFVGAATNNTFNPIAVAWQFPLSLFSTSTIMKADFNLYAVPTSGSSKIYQGDIYIERKILWLFTVKNYFTQCNIFSRPEMMPLDNAPGGVYDMDAFGFDPTTIQNQLPNFFNSLRLAAPHRRFCFIPTVSSLAFDNPWQYYRQPICNNIPCHIPSQVADLYCTANG